MRSKSRRGALKSSVTRASRPRFQIPPSIRTSQRAGKASVRREESPHCAEVVGFGVPGGKLKLIGGNASPFNARHRLCAFPFTAGVDSDQRAWKTGTMLELGEGGNALLRKIGARLFREILHFY